MWQVDYFPSSIGPRSQQSSHTALLQDSPFPSLTVLLKYTSSDEAYSDGVMCLFPTDFFALAASQSRLQQSDQLHDLMNPPFVGKGTFLYKNW